MDLKERLNRLTSVSKSPPEEKSQVLSDLRQRLDRLLEPKKIYRKEVTVPIEQLIRGEVISTSEGETFLTKIYFPPHFQYGEMTLADVLTIPTYPAHLLSRDDRLRELDFRRALFLDTETTGLTGGTGTFAFMVGLGFFEEDHFVIQQFFMRDYSEERATLSLLKDMINTFQFLVTFNGRQYDIPLLETRFILSRIISKIREVPNFDLLYPSRKIWKGAYENCRLVTLESQLLGIERTDDIPSEWIPFLYFDYIQTGDARKIHQVFYHNQMDILSMVALAGRIHLVYHDPKAARPRKGIEHFALGRLFWEHGQKDKAIPCFEIALKRCNDDLSWDVMKWLSMAFKKTGQPEKARSLWEEMASWPYKKDAFPYVELAKYYEHRLKDWEGAMTYVNEALGLVPSHQQREVELLQNRRRRLEQKKVSNRNRRQVGY
ncbi:MAG: ribonuclease H-like domain-containing protein [Syntrophaceae bacterium]|nr:ribonuclease H-like domain-containing protein [Syntrophaceae bacterium]